MKKLFVGLVVLALSVWTLGAVEQKFSSLPIGANLDGYINGIEILVVGDGLNASAWQSYPYSRNRDGKLETFASQKLRDYTASIKLANGTTAYGWAINARTDGVGGLLPTYNGKAASAVIASAPLIDESDEFHLTLRNGKWEVPEEVFGKVKFQFGWGLWYYIPGVTGLEINLYAGSRISRFSTIERVSEADNPCELPAILLELPNDVMIPNEIALAKPSWWERAEITLYTKAESVTFLVNRTEQDGKAIRWSNPPPSFFVPPAPSKPKIASLKRVRNTTEITISAEATSVANLEFSETLNGSWYSIPKYPQPLSLQTGSSKFTHTTEALSCFYRVRIVQSERQ
ncbi:MAG: hypothetical protein G01um101417_496 [Parcubacteria group bacterium Gr01-1014_17]|nr:MAG: hypothetical protein G01um101417_496 [Parcubacteria group bacterium Gr01-1014_17]